MTTTEEFAFIQDYNNFSSFGVKIWNNKNSEHESASIVIKQPIKTVTIFIRNKRYQFRCGLCGFSRWQHIFVIHVNYWLRITDLQQLFQTASWETPTFTDHWPTFMFLLTNKRAIFFFKDHDTRTYIRADNIWLDELSLQKCEGTNQNKAWIIHENEKNSASCPTLKRHVQDWPRVLIEV